MRPVRALGAAMVLGVLGLCACGGSGAKSPDTPQYTSIVQGTVTLAATPHRIVSLSPTSTEMLYAIGAGSQVVAVDDQSDYPAGVPKTKLSGFKPNAEAVIAYKPDLVVLAEDTGGIVKALKQVKIPVLLEPAAVELADTYKELGELGTATGHEPAAGTLATGMQQQIAAVVKATPKPVQPLSYYHELTNDLYTVTSSTFLGQVYGLFGLRNVANAADKQGSGYPQLSKEALLTDNPDLIFLADTRCCGQSASSVAKRPGWSKLAAVKDGQVIGLDDDLASRWGPRLVELVKAIGAAVQKAEQRK